MSKTISLVTGANKGIGLETVKQLAALGHHVLLAARDPGKAAEAASTLGGSVEPLALDVTDDASIAAAVATSLQNGTLRLAIDATGFLHDARFAPEKSLRELDAEHLAHAVAINATGPALLMKHLLPHLPHSCHDSQQAQRLWRLSEFFRSWV